MDLLDQLKTNGLQILLSIGLVGFVLRGRILPFFKGLKLPFKKKETIDAPVSKRERMFNHWNGLYADADKGCRAQLEALLPKLMKEEHKHDE